jgi:hypothetical protein
VRGKAVIRAEGDTPPGGSRDWTVRWRVWELRSVDETTEPPTVTDMVEAHGTFEVKDRSLGDAIIFANNVLYHHYKAAQIDIRVLTGYASHPRDGELEFSDN